MVEDFNFDEWYVKMMAIPNESFDKEIKRIEEERRERCEEWLRSKEPQLRTPVRKEEEDVWQKSLD